ncbi:MAG: cytidine deaminase [Clostridia bacterium]|nr:cytidine deaminase [Clostridia bacterium]
MVNILKMLDEVMERSYSPYSNCKVACVLVFSDRLVCGTNVENASYGSTICAERSAIVGAISNGADMSTLSAIYIKSNKEQFFTPCGACLQVISEFASADVDVVVLNKNNEHRDFKFADLMPNKFDKDKLN